jgi:hypothetical protein
MTTMRRNWERLRGVIVKMGLKLNDGETQDIVAQAHDTDSLKEDATCEGSGATEDSPAP